MKSLSILFFTMSLLLLLSCATSNYKIGNDFSSDNVKKIVKGKTTSNELVVLFGQPFTKYVMSETETKWTYTYHQGTSTAETYIVTTQVKTTGTQKTLDILLKNGIVSNFTFTESDIPSVSVY